MHMNRDWEETPLVCLLSPAAIHPSALSIQPLHPRRSLTITPTVGGCFSLLLCPIEKNLNAYPRFFIFAVTVQLRFKLSFCCLVWTRTSLVSIFFQALRSIWLLIQGLIIELESSVSISHCRSLACFRVLHSLVPCSSLFLAHSRPLGFVYFLLPGVRRFIPTE